MFYLLCSFAFCLPVNLLNRLFEFGTSVCAILGRECFTFNEWYFRPRFAGTHTVLLSVHCIFDCEAPNMFLEKKKGRI
jgi:hypothetical protein